MKLLQALIFRQRKLKKIGERIITLQKLFNVREINATREEDTFPEIVFKEPLKGRHRYPKEQFELLLDEYYESHGWDVKTGLPTVEKIKELNLYDEICKSQTLVHKLPNKGK